MRRMKRDLADHGESLVFATRPIMTFEPLIRAAPRKEQYLLHRSSEYAKRGFTKRQLATQPKA